MYKVQTFAWKIYKDSSMYCTSYINIICTYFMVYTTIYRQLYYPLSTSVVCTSCFTQLYTASCTILYQHQLYVLHVLDNYIPPVVLSYINISSMYFMFYTTIYRQLYFMYCKLYKPQAFIILWISEILLVFYKEILFSFK